MLLLIQSLIIIILNLANLCGSNNPCLEAELDGISTRNFISPSYTTNNVTNLQRETLSYTQKFFCRAASTVTAGIILYSLYYLSFEI